MQRYTLILATTIAAFALSTSSASADLTLYATSPFSGQLYTVDTATKTFAPLFTTVGASDSLVFAPNGDIIYSNGSGQIRDYNLTTHIDKLVAGGLGSRNLADVTLEPGGTSVLVADRGGGAIIRVNLGGGSSTLATYGPIVQGLAYDGSGRLFANIGNTIDQIDPTTGAILKSATLIGGDGLTYNSVTGKLYDASYAGNAIYTVDPTTLNVTFLTGFSNFGPDGLTSDTNGNLWIASFNLQQVYEYNFGTGTLTANAFVPSVDDLAPASGLGAPVPEPSNLVTAGAGMLLALGYAAWRRRRTSAEIKAGLGDTILVAGDRD
jgi:sugar lactone lactonase YvrE